MLGLTPQEFYNCTLVEIVEWAYYKTMSLNKERDFELQSIAWQTALLMNSSGNYKKKIEPSDLYQSPYDKKEKINEDTATEMLDEESKKNKVKNKDKQLADLKSKFGK